MLMGLGEQRQDLGP